jgi:hypothetical protein
MKSPENNEDQNPPHSPRQKNLVKNSHSTLYSPVPIDMYRKK